MAALGHCLCLETNRRWGETCVPLDVPVYYSLFPPSSFERLSFIWRLSSAEKLLLLKMEHLDLALFTDGSIRPHFHHSILFGLFLKALKLGPFWRRRFKPAANVPWCLPQSCKPAEFPSDPLQKIWFSFAPCWRTRILSPGSTFHALSAALITSYCSRRAFRTIWKAVQIWAQFGRDAEMIPKDQSSSSIRMTKKMWEKE